MDAGMDSGSFSTVSMATVVRETSLREDTIVEEEVDEGGEGGTVPGEGDSGFEHESAADTGDVPPAVPPDSDEEWDTDLEDEDYPGTRRYRHLEGNRPRAVYLAACKQLNIVPSQRYLKGLEDDSRVINVNYQGLGPVGTRAVATSLVMDTLTTELHLAGNMLGRDGIRHISDMIRENEFITTLDLSENQLDTYGAQKVADIFLENVNLATLNLSANRFTANDAVFIANFLANSVVSRTGRYIALRDLDLSHNEFGEKGAQILGHALGDNETLVTLNLSWNQIRHEGVTCIATGIGENNMLKSLDLSNNGVDNKSVDAIAKALTKNRTLEVLNMSGNRIGVDGMAGLFKGVGANECLRVLKLTNNPITLQGPMVALTLLQKSKICILEELEMADACVPREFAPLLQTVLTERPEFRVQHGGFMDYRERFKSEKKAIVDSYMKDPVLLFLHFIEDRKLKLIHIFQSFDTDKSLAITRSEFKLGLQEVYMRFTGLRKVMHTDAEGAGEHHFSKNFGCPMSDSQLDHMIARIDIDHDGEIDLGEFMEGIDEHRHRLKKFLKQMPSTPASRAESPTDTNTPPTTKTHARPSSKTRPKSRKQNSRPTTPHNVITPQIMINIDDGFGQSPPPGGGEPEGEMYSYSPEMADDDTYHLHVPYEDPSLMLTKAATLP